MPVPPSTGEPHFNGARPATVHSGWNDLTRALGKDTPRQLVKMAAHRRALSRVGRRLAR